MGLIAFAIMLLVGCINIFNAAHAFVDLMGSPRSEYFDKKVLGFSMSAIDQFLIATFFFIFSFGIFKLFLTRPGDQKYELTAFKVNNLDDLRDKLGKTIVLAIIIDYFKLALELTYNSSLTLLYLAIGILIIAIALFFTRGLVSSIKDKESGQSKIDLSDLTQIENPPG